MIYFFEKTTTRWIFTSVGMFAILFQIFWFAFSTYGANFSQAYIRLDRLKSSTATGGTVCANPATVGTEADVQVTFPTVAGTDFTVNGTAGNWTVTTSNLPPTATAWPSIGTATAVSGKTVTFPSGDLTAGTLYCFNFSGTTTLTTGAAGDNQVGTIVTRTSGTTTIDSSSYGLSVVSNDQVVITATVPPTFSFALSGNTDTFTSNLSTTTTSTSGVTVSIGTNAGDGWVAWVKSANAGLNSASTGQAIATAGSYDDAPTDLASTTGYVLDVDITTDSATGTGTITQDAGSGSPGDGYGAEYNGTNTTSGGTLTTSFQPIAASDGTTGGDVLTFIGRAKITAVQAAASDYTDTLTLVAAGRF